MNDLDDLDLIAKVDPSDFLGSVEQFPEQLREAVAIGRAVQPLPQIDNIRSITVLGMGGSGIAGDVLEAVLRRRSQIQVRTIKGYGQYSWPSPDDLVFAVSYSGNTEETLASFERAERIAPIIAVTTGGKLAQRAQERGAPIALIPPGLQPRAALGYVAMPMLVAYDRMVQDDYSRRGIDDHDSSLASEIEDAIQLVEERSREWGRKSPTDENPAKQLAQKLLGKIPIIYGSEGIAEVAAYRWKCQFNECSKVPAWWNVFPELNHNEIVGTAGLNDVTARHLALIVLREFREDARIAKRIETTLPLIERSFSAVHQLQATRPLDLGPLLELIYFGDFVATYLAIAQGVDPAPVEVIETLKKKLAE